MNIKNRLMKLEQMIKPEQMPLVMIKFEDEWTPEQQQQLNEAEVNEQKIIVVEFS
ncbi:hypothetical protein R2083_13900 [Nitrosomonas sp. Is35]|uniref:hypothetical protein n=1 Tax=Nitrosomonas sp. Is35 TaxID=3080534 RepID=UPI00294B5D1D|nr:hypothetical protein [Nitrosomonas sp. Is35]MDV6348611.1 hypothetical protein [Nitrosomonas sp. Is35]